MINASQLFSKNHFPHQGVKAVILDWAGTAVDFGSMAPTLAFIEVFKKKSIFITAHEVRASMGKHKRDHTHDILFSLAVFEQWKEVYGRSPTESDVEQLFSELTPALKEVLPFCSKLIPGVLEFSETMKRHHIAIGSTTGYTAEMMINVEREAKKQGYVPDTVVNVSEVPCGRPAPSMCYLNAMKLNLFPLTHMVKIGDTVADILEGKNAGMITIGVTLSGNEVGLSEEEVSALRSSHPSLLQEKIFIAEKRLTDAGADFVVEGIWQAADVILKIDQWLKELTRRRI